MCTLFKRQVEHRPVEQILINTSREERRVAILDDGLLQDLFIERACARGLVGNVYWGQVVRVLPGMQSAFLDVGLERTAFLHIAEIEGARMDTGTFKPIESLLHEGQRLMVQVAKDPIGTKGARLTTTISLAGRKLVYLPNDSHIGVSQRIEDAALREELRTLATTVRQKDEKGGYIVRTCAEEGATEQEFLSDMAYLARLWDGIRHRAQEVKKPTLLYQDLTLAQRTLRDMVHEGTAVIEVDDEAEYEALLEFAKHFVPAAVDKLHHYEGERPLFEQYDIDEEIELALGRRVELKSGGYLVFDQTEAMSTIDVNTGAYVGKRDFSDTVFKTNLEAAQVIARQLRLRNLGGIIIVDFIDMAKDEHREAVLSELRRAVSLDRTKMTVSGFNELGLVAMTRKRGGRGEIKTARTVCYDILREITRLAKLYKEMKEFRILASQTVIDLLLEEESQALELLQQAIERPILLEVESVYTQEQWDVIIA
ncbi:MAG: ribonuclease E/G [Sutterella sp. 54_7]|nr:MAG: ribonuclease E/G [Sutterella sp. 54_7]